MMRKVDIDIASQMLAENVNTVLNNIVRDKCRELIVKFDTTVPHPAPDQAVEMVYKIKVEMQAIYAILEKMGELKRGKTRGVSLTKIKKD